MNDLKENVVYCASGAIESIIKAHKKAMDFLMMPEKKVIWICADWHKQNYAYYEFLNNINPVWNYKPNRSQLKINTFENTSIKFRNAHNYEYLRGESVDLLILQDYNNYEDKAINEVIKILMMRIK